MLYSAVGAAVAESACGSSELLFLQCIAQYEGCMPLRVNLCVCYIFFRTSLVVYASLRSPNARRPFEGLSAGHLAHYVASSVLTPPLPNRCSSVRALLVLRASSGSSAAVLALRFRHVEVRHGMTWCCFGVAGTCCHLAAAAVHVLPG
jgi:hypothetical protein